jgi:hypothetical protein
MNNAKKYDFDKDFLNYRNLSSAIEMIFKWIAAQVSTFGSIQSN